MLQIYYDLDWKEAGEEGRICPVSHQLMYIMVLDYTVISTIIVATGACDRHTLLNEHRDVMTGFMEPNTSVPPTFNYLTSRFPQV